MMYIDYIIVIAFISFGIYAGFLFYKDAVEKRKIKKHIGSLPEKREDRPGVSISNKPPLTGAGQFDKQRTTYTEGDNT